MNKTKIVTAHFTAPIDARSDFVSQGTPAANAQMIVACLKAAHECIDEYCALIASIGGDNDEASQDHFDLRTNIGALIGELSTTQENENE